MAKPYKAKDASYYFREVKANEMWTCSKFPGAKGGEGDAPSDVYNLREEGKAGGKSNIVCSCPASWGGRSSGGHEWRKPCKHGGWLERWRGMRAKGILPAGMVSYYNSADDRFYPVPGLAEVDPVELDQEQALDADRVHTPVPCVAASCAHPRRCHYEKKCLLKNQEHPGAAFMRQGKEEE